MSTDKKQSQNSRHQPSLYDSWKNQVSAAIRFSLRRLWYNPISTWITLFAIALALSLPAGMHLFIKNLQTLTDNNRQIPTISLFLHQETTIQQARDRAELIAELPDVEKVDVITKDDAIDEFASITEFVESIKTLGDNLLPHVLVVTPKLNSPHTMGQDIKSLTDKLQNYIEVDTVQADIEWVMRLQRIIAIADRITWVIGILLALTVLLVIGNTIRLDIENRKQEIDVARFIGATHAYIRRPFVLGGLWLGLFGGIISLVVVHLAMLSLVPKVNELSSTYGGQFTLTGLNFSMTFIILLSSGLLGVIGAWLAVSQHLRQQKIIL